MGSVERRVAESCWHLHTVCLTPGGRGADRPTAPSTYRHQEAKGMTRELRVCVCVCPVQTEMSSSMFDIKVWCKESRDMRYFTLQAFLYFILLCFLV